MREARLVALTAPGSHTPSYCRLMDRVTLPFIVNSSVCTRGLPAKRGRASAQNGF